MEDRRPGRTGRRASRLRGPVHDDPAHRARQRDAAVRHLPHRHDGDGAGRDRRRPRPRGRIHRPLGWCALRARRLHREVPLRGARGRRQLGSGDTSGSPLVGDAAYGPPSTKPISQILHEGRIRTDERAHAHRSAPFRTMPLATEIRTLRLSPAYDSATRDRVCLVRGAFDAARGSSSSCAVGRLPSPWCASGHAAQHQRGDHQPREGPHAQRGRGLGEPPRTIDLDHGRAVGQDG